MASWILESSTIGPYDFCDAKMQTESWNPFKKMEFTV